MLTGAAVNAACVIAGGLLGTFIKNGLTERLNRTLMNGLGLVVLYIGISGALKGQNPLVAVLSVVASVIVMELICRNKGMRRLGAHLQEKIGASGERSMMAEGFVTFSLLICVGAMSIVGSLQSGMSGNHEILYAKSVIDGVSALVMGSIWGAGVCLAGVSVFVYQGLLTLSAKAVSAYLTTPMVDEITCVGSILIIAIALNMLKITNIQITSYILAPFLAILFCILLQV